MRLIRSRNQLSFLVVAATWVLILGLPAMLFRFSLGQFLQNRYLQSLHRAKSLLFTELERFKSDLEFTGILEHDLRDFNRANGFVELKSVEMQKFCSANKDVDAARIKRLLERHLGIPVFAVFAHGPDTLQVDGTVAADSKAEVSVPPRNMLRRFFSLLNRQHEMVAVSDSYKPAFAAGTDIEDVRTVLTYHENFLQRLFGTVVGFRMEPDRVYKSIASKIGDTGPIFLYYARSYCRNKGKEHNLGGYLAVIRTSDVPERHIIRKASATTFYGNMRRRVVPLEAVIPFPDDYAERGLSRFVEYPDRIALQTMATPRQIVRMIQKGSIVPRDFSAFSGQTAGIEISFPKHELEHPLQVYVNTIDLVLKLFLILGGMLMMRLYLFGFDLNVSLAYKTSVAVVAAALLPLLSLALSLVAYHDFAANAQNDRIQRYLKISVARVQHLLAEKIAENERQHRDLATALGKMSHLPEEQLIEYIQKWVNSRPVHLLMYKRFDAVTIQIQAEGTRSELVKRSADATNLILQSIVELLLSSPRLNPDVKSLSKVMTEAAQNVEGTNSMLMSNAQLLNLPKFAKYVRIAFMAVFADEHVQRKPVAMTVVVYSLEKLVDEVLLELTRKIPLAQNLDGMDLDFAFGTTEGRKIICLPKNRSNRLSSTFVGEQMHACNSLQQEMQWHGRQADAEFFSLTHMNQSLPVICLARVTRNGSDGGWLDFSTLVQWLFPALIMLLVLIVSRIFFIEPALRFAGGLTAIADGNLGHRLESDGGDEFADLAIEFNQMAKSLQEKEKLESYVSSDVLREARESVLASLQPGGEKIAATVAFVSLLPADKAAVKTGGAQLIASVNRFFNFSQVLCTENDGVIDKIIGHTLMMVFRAGSDRESHQLRACRVATRLVDSIKASELGSSCRVAAGLACGQLVSGKIGSRNGKLDFTVIGDTVNLAARLKSYAENLDGSVILLSDAMLPEISGEFAIRLESEVQLKGKSTQTSVYRVDL